MSETDIEEELAYSNKFKLSQIEGDQPQISFQLVVSGAKEAYSHVMNIVNKIAPETSIKNPKLTYEDSQFYQAVCQLELYVLRHKVCVNHPNSDEETIYRNLNELINIVYATWKWSLDVKAEVEVSGGTYSDAYRYFSLFVQAASTRISLDWVAFNPQFPPYLYRLEDSSATEDDLIIIKVADLHLLLSVPLKLRDGGTSFELESEHNLVAHIPDTFNFPDEHFLRLYAPVFPEVGYRYIGLKPTARVQFMTRSNAIDWLAKEPRYIKTEIVL